MLRRSLSQTIETYPSVEFPTYNLVNGVLIATNDGTSDATALSVDVGDPVDFEVGSTDGAPIYCAFVRTLIFLIYISAVVPFCWLGCISKTHVPLFSHSRSAPRLQEVA